MKLHFAFVLALFGGPALAQTGEIFIPGKNNETVQLKPVPTNPLANCLANPSAATCTGVSTNRSGVTFETDTGQPTITYETLILDLNDGYVHAKPEPPKKPVDYDKPVTPPNYSPPPQHGIQRFVNAKRFKGATKQQSI